MYTVDEVWLLPYIPGGFHRTFATGARLANRGRLLLRTPGHVPFGTCICSNVEIFFPELAMSTDLLSFEHPSIPLFCLVSLLFKLNQFSQETRLICRLLKPKEDICIGIYVI